jgi:hypothetical protein
MVAACHLIFGPYGCWLPNDPRGSSSHEVRNSLLIELADLHHGRKSIQPCSAEIRAFYRQAEPLLQHPVLRFDDIDIRLIGEAFATTIARRYTCYGCAIMSDHVHVLIRKHRDLAEEMIFNLQEASREKLIAAGRRSVDHPTWGGPGWKVYLNTSEDIERVIRYIAENPIKAKRPAQVWPFVQEYDGWLPGVGATRKKSSPRKPLH